MSRGAPPPERYIRLAATIRMELGRLASVVNEASAALRSDLERFLEFLDQAARTV